MLNIGKKYQLGELIHQGKVTSIFKGTIVGENLPIVIKLLKKESVTEKTLSVLQNEYSLLKNIQAAQIIEAFEFEEFGGSHFITFESFSSDSLTKHIENESLDIKTALRIAIEIAEGIGQIHKSNVIHKEIKPENILVNEQYKVKIIDLGMATTLAFEAQEEIQPENFEGPLYYISPEQTGRSNVVLDYRTDIYSFGVVLYHLFTHRLPFNAIKPSELVYQHVAQKPVPPMEVNTDLSEALSNIILKCLKKNAEDRYKSAFGLKNDLEKCLLLLEEKGDISTFSLAEMDLYDKYHTPDKLFGRHSELTIINDCLREVSQDSVCLLEVKGLSGIGKSSLLRELQKKVTERYWRLASVAFDQFKKNIPYYGISEVYTILIHQILSESDDVIENWKKQILDCVEKNGQILIDIIPDLQLIIGPQPSVEVLTPQESENRFRYIFIKFMKLMLKSDRPLVFIFDDFQWGDEATLKILEYFLQDTNIKNFLVVFSYRDNEVSQIHPLNITLNLLAEANLEIKQIYVIPLELDGIKQIINEVFSGLDKDVRDELSRIIKQVTFGNSFFVVQMLKYLYESNLIKFDAIQLKWNADIEKIKSMKSPENVAELLTKNISKLDRNLLEIMKLCSAIGDQFQLQTVATIIGKNESQTRGLLNYAMAEEYIRLESSRSTNSSQSYRFIHDKIQQLFYSLIEEDELHRLHYTIGKILLTKSTPKEIDANIVTIVNHLNFGIKLSKKDINKQDFVKLNLKAGLKIKNAQAYHQAIPYFKTAIDTQPENSWKTEPDLTYSLYENYATCLQLVGEVERSERIFDFCLQNANTAYQKVDIYIKIINLMTQIKDYNKVFNYAKKAFELLDYSINLDPNIVEIAYLSLKIKFRLMFFSKDDLKNMATCTDERVLRITEVLTSIGFPSYTTGKRLLWYNIALANIDLFLSHGAVPASSSAFCGYALTLCHEKIADYERAYEYGFLGYQLSNRYESSIQSCLAGLMYVYFILRLKVLLDDVIPPLEIVYRDCMSKGAITLGGTSVLTIELIKIMIGKNLPLILDSTNARIDEFQKLNSPAEVNILLVFRNFCLCLTGENYDPTNCCPREFADEIYEKGDIKADRLYLVTYAIWHFVLLYLFNRFNEAKAEIPHLMDLSEKFTGLLEWPYIYYHCALTLAAPMKSISDNPKDWNEIQKISNKLELWANASPHNYNSYLLLVKGEMYRIQHKTELAIKCYSDAIKIAKIHGNNFLIGEAYEVFARNYIQLGVADITTHFLQNAVYYFKLWGAIAKSEDIQNRYSEYFILKETLSKDISETTWSSTMTHNTSPTLADTMTKTVGTAIEDMRLDINKIIETSQKFSKEIIFDKLMESLTKLLISTSGANKILLILNVNGINYVYAEGYADRSYVPISEPFPLENYRDKISMNVINAVSTLKKDVLLNELNNKEKHLDDPYIQANDTKSIFCLPLLQKGDLKGILYLENTENENAFSPRMLRNLSLLSSQITISIENAQLYATLEGKVISRTKELQEKNVELQLALKHIQEVQDQLVQQEKLASLGLLTAGIAHELKNPLNFIINFSQIAKDNLIELKTEIEKDNIDEQLALTDEISDNLSTVDVHGHRASDIIKGMLSHAHQGTKNVEFVDINALVEQGLGLAYYSFRKKNPSFNIQINKSYDSELKPIEAFSGDLLRVIVNVIDNSCFGISQRMAEDTANYQPFFEIKTYREEGNLVIAFSDNGIGIPQENLDKIFNPFFTTRPAGTGTGLGLSIAYDIISKQHNGTITATSKPYELTEFIIKLPYKIE